MARHTQQTPGQRTTPNRQIDKLRNIKEKEAFLQPAWCLSTPLNHQDVNMLINMLNVAVFVDLTQCTPVCLQKGRLLHLL